MTKIIQSPDLFVMQVEMDVYTMLKKVSSLFESLAYVDVLGAAGSLCTVCITPKYSYVNLIDLNMAVTTKMRIV